MKKKIAVLGIIFMTIGFFSIGAGTLDYALKASRGYAKDVEQTEGQTEMEEERRIQIRNIGII